MSEASATKRLHLRQEVVLWACLAQYRSVLSLSTLIFRLHLSPFSRVNSHWLLQVSFIMVRRSYLCVSAPAKFIFFAPVSTSPRPLEAVQRGGSHTQQSPGRFSWTGIRLKETSTDIDYVQNIITEQIMRAISLPSTQGAEAREEPNKCHKCGKVCKTSSGLTAHKKLCKGITDCSETKITLFCFPPLRKLLKTKN